MPTGRRLVLARAAATGLALAACGCVGPATPSLTTVPPDWRVRPFGPEANDARACGELRPLFLPPQACLWEEFARAHVRDGDVLFRLGRSRTLRGALTSRFLADVSDSRFSHDGLARWEDGQLWVYDAESQGVRKVPFVFWMMDVSDGCFAVKRLRPHSQGAVPAALAYCEDAYRRQLPYNFWLRPGDGGLYCAELIENAFRAGGVALSEPLPVRRLPHYRRYVLLGLAVEALTPLRVDQPIYALGNAHYGAYGSPCLELVYEGGGSDAGQEGRTPPLGHPCAADGEE